VADMERLFGGGFCDPQGCVVAVCLREEKEGSHVDAPKSLYDMVVR